MQYESLDIENIVYIYVKSFIYESQKFLIGQYKVPNFKMPSFKLVSDFGAQSSVSRSKMFEDVLIQSL